MSPSRWTWSAAALTVLSALLPVSLCDRGLAPLDEGKILQIADRLAGGEVLYRDISTDVSAAVHYGAVALLALFGRDMLVLRLAELAVLGVIAVLLWRIALRVVDPFFAMLAPAGLGALVVWNFPALGIWSQGNLAAMLALAALLACLAMLESPAGRRSSALGALLALLLWTAPATAAAMVAVTVYALVLARRADPDALRSRTGALLGAAAATATVVVSLPLAAFARAGALGRLLQDTIAGAPAAAAHHQPLPPIFGAHPEGAGMFQFLYAPPALHEYLVRAATLLGVRVDVDLVEAAIRASYGAACLAAVVAAVWALAACVGRHGRRRDVATAVVMAAAFAISCTVYPSAIASRLAVVWPPLLLVAAVVADRAAAARAATRRRGTDHGEAAPGAATWGQAAVRIVALGSVAAALAISARVAADLRAWNDSPLASPGAGIRTNHIHANLYDGAARWLRECATDGQPVLAAPDMGLLHFLAERPNPVPAAQLLPGDVEDEVVLARTIDVRCAVYRPRFYWHFGRFADWYPMTAAMLEAEFVVADRLRNGAQEWRLLRRRR
jgi:hypothetical protein